MAKLSDHSSDESPANSSEQEQLPVNEEEDEEELEAVTRTAATDDDDVADPTADEDNDDEDNQVYFALFTFLYHNSIDLSLLKLISLFFSVWKPSSFQSSFS